MRVFCKASGKIERRKGVLKILRNAITYPLNALVSCGDVPERHAYRQVLVVYEEWDK